MDGERHAGDDEDTGVDREEGVDEGILTKFMAVMGGEGLIRCGE